MATVPGPHVDDLPFPFQRAHQVGPVPDSAVGDRGVGIRELEGRHGDTVAHRGVRRRLLVPDPRRNDARVFTVEVDSGDLAEAERGDQLLHRLRAGQATRLDRADVARLGDRGAEGEFGKRLVVLDQGLADADPAVAAVHDLVGMHHASFERAGRRDHLERRARFVRVLQRTVPPLVRAEVAEPVRIERRVGGHRQHRRVLGGQDDDAAGTGARRLDRLAKSALGEVLNRRVDRQMEVRSRFRLAQGTGNHDQSLLPIAEDMPSDRFARDLPVVAVLQAGEAAVRADEAKHVSHQGAHRVLALALAEKVEAGERRQVDPVGHFAVQLARQGHVARFVEQRLDPFPGPADQGSDLGGNNRRLAHLRGLGVERARLHRDREWSAAGVVDRAPLRIQDDFASLLARRPLAVFVGPANLQVEQSHGDRAHPQAA